MDVKMVVRGLGGLVLRMRMDRYPLAWEGPRSSMPFQIEDEELGSPRNHSPCRTMIGENRQLVTDEPVEFEK